MLVSVALGVQYSLVTEVERILFPIVYPNILTFLGHNCYCDLGEAGPCYISTSAVHTVSRCHQPSWDWEMEMWIPMGALEGCPERRRCLQGRHNCNIPTTGP
jgi:hypothetical protein